MPSPTTAPKASNKKTPERKAVNLAQGLARKRSQDFKSKIDGWNDAGAGEQQGDDEIVVVEEVEPPALSGETKVVPVDEDVGKDTPSDDAASPPKTPSSGVKAAEKQAAHRKTSREIDMQKKAWVRRKSKPAVDITPEVKEATTPKKRVVSDGHWRRDRVKKDGLSLEKEKEEEKEMPKQTTPKPIVIRRSVASVGLKVPPSIQSFVEDHEPEPVKVRKVQRRSQSRELDGDKEGSPAFETSGTKVYVKRRGRSGLHASDSSFTAPSSDRRSSNTDITTPDMSPTKAETSRPGTAPKQRTRNSADQAALLSRSADEPSRKVSRPKKPSPPKDDGIPSKPKIPATHKPPVPVPKFPNTRIEGWLSEMPEDPFTAVSEPSEIADPPSGRRTRHRADEDDRGVGLRRSSGKAHHSKPTIDSIDDNLAGEASTGWNTIDDWVHNSTPTGLKRSGARRNTQSPLKDRSMRESSVALEEDRELQEDGGRTRRTLYNDLESRASDGGDRAYGAGLKRRLTKHSDLMSVLSQSRDDTKIAPNRSIRSRCVRSGVNSIADIMADVSTDELKYQRELRTLVDGVVPVLLTYVISKANAEKAPESRKSSLHENPALTQPIYAMGVSLERLKSAHRRIPMHDPNELLLWAQNTSALYSDYLKAWRLGFDDIVVNLAPAAEHRDASDPANAEGERVDVAHLLKRPLVRIKTLSKNLKAINAFKPSALASDMTATYEDLVLEARRRSNDERARLEDEAAAAIDPTRARDPRNLAQLIGVHIDPSRSVRARDFFDLDLYHSSGQQLGCKVELIRRDNSPSIDGPGDLLFCEVSSTSRWLLFPPILANNVSARKGESESEMVVMVRGSGQAGSQWREIMSLQGSREQVEEWIQMLGSNPLPPRLTRQSSFNALRLPSKADIATPSPTESEVPIGERAGPSAPVWDGSEVNSVLGELRAPNLRNSRPKRYHGPGAMSAGQQHAPQSGERVWPSTVDSQSNEPAHGDDRPAQRPAMHRRASSVPSQELPTIPKLRQPQSEKKTKGSILSEAAREPHADSQDSPQDGHRSAPAPPQHSTRPTSLGLQPGALPSFTPAFLKKHRRSSSPLKHEYEPSTASELTEDSDFSDSDDDRSVTSHSTVDEAISTLGELKDFNKFGPARASPRTSRFDQDSLRPSDSPSQAPYRSVPPSTEEAGKCFATVWYWEEASGKWLPLHIEECEIVVTPGLIEAFDASMTRGLSYTDEQATRANPSQHGIRPLVALELTPWVLLRRGTVVDISVNSPPTAESVLRRGRNTMFRARNADECARLYALINRARIDNPTWIALQNARGPTTSNWAEVMDQRNAARAASSPSWLRSLSRKGSTYRSKGTRSASIAASQASVGSMSSAMSALRKFSGGGRFFNIAKSTITSRQGTRSSGSDSLDSGAATPMPPVDPSLGTPLGRTNTKCRLYKDLGTRNWLDMGSARVTVLLPPRPDPGAPADPNITEVTKRMIITGKSKGETLLDVTLPESHFERLGRVGVGVQWTHERSQVAATGGVGLSQTETYCIQLLKERDASFVFGMVGKQRYYN